jgi:hypothetical protein
VLRDWNLTMMRLRSGAERREITFLSEHEDGKTRSSVCQFAEEHSIVHDHSKGFSRGVETEKPHKKDGTNIYLA